MASSLQWTGKCCWQSAGANMAECISSTKHSEQRNIKKQEHSEHDCVLWQTRDFWFRAFVCICAVPFHLYNLPCWRDYLWLQHKGSMGCASSLSGFLSGCQRSCKNLHCNNGLEANAFTAKSRSNVFIPFSVSYQQWLLVTLVQIQMISIYIKSNDSIFFYSTLTLSKCQHGGHGRAYDLLCLRAFFLFATSMPCQLPWKLFDFTMSPCEVVQNNTGLNRI
jgi:hypothetical protein